jgi:uncharacterized phage protein (TIGR02218 family)
MRSWGDGRCGVDLDAPGYRAEAEIAGLGADGALELAPLPGMAAGWFERGALKMLDGPAEGLRAWIKADRVGEASRVIVPWAALRVAPRVGDHVRLTAGCDKRAETCRAKFHNFSNFRGFPHLPDEDWLMAHPAQGGVHDGGARS